MNLPPRIEYIARFSLNQKKKKRFDVKEVQNTSKNTSTTTVDSEQSTSQRDSSTNPVFVLNDNDKCKKISVSSKNKPSLLSTEEKVDPIQIKQSVMHRFVNWFNQLPLKDKLLFGSVLAILSISLLVAAIIPPVYLFVIYRSNSQSSFTLKNFSSCSTSTCIGQETPYRSSIVSVLYPFDGNTNDQSGYATGVVFGSTAHSYLSYAYTGQAILLTSTSQHYIKIPSVDLTRKSFTIQTWMYPISVTGTIDFGIFSQCDLNSHCLSLSLRSSRFVLSFDSMNTSNVTLIGSSLIGFNGYVHVTIVYDAILFQQQIYVDGVIDAVSSGMVDPYLGNSSSTTTTIGRSSSYAYGVTYFNGRFDHFTISAGVARSACQIYNDVSLVAYFPFDTTDTYHDHSVLLCNGIESGTTKISPGRVNQAISFTSSTSYFLSECFPRMRGAEDSFSVSFWVNPTSTTNGGSLVHISSNSDGSGTCYDHLVFTSTGALVFQWMTSVTSVSSARGPMIPIDTWTHVAVVYSKNNGMRLFIDGKFSRSSPGVGSLTLYDSGIPAYIMLGNISPLGSAATFTCPSGTIATLPGHFSGSIDEFRLYNRELNNQEICVLANP